DSSLPGLTPQVGYTRLATIKTAELGQARVPMQSIHLRKNFFGKKMDARIKSAHDGVARFESDTIASHRCEEIGAGALLELARSLGAEANGIGDGALPPRLVDVAAVGLGDQAAKAQPPGGDGGVARDRRATGALEHREEGALGRERGRGVGVVDRSKQRERAPLLPARPHR